jgi:hypothetical protein
MVKTLHRARLSLRTAAILALLILPGFLLGLLGHQALLVAISQR